MRKQYHLLPAETGFDAWDVDRPLLEVNPTYPIILGHGGRVMDGMHRVVRALRYGLLPETEVDFVDDDGIVQIVPRRSARPDRGDRAVDALRGTGYRRMSTDELLRLTRD